MFDRALERAGTWMGRAFAAVVSLGMKDEPPGRRRRSQAPGERPRVSDGGGAAGVVGEEGTWARAFEHRDAPEAQPNPGDPGVAIPTPEGLLDPQQEPSIPSRDELPRGL
jgi:hypothetical protein